MVSEPWDVEWAGEAERGLKRCDKAIAGRLLEAVDRFVTTGQGDVKKLKGKDGLYRLRVGDWRLIFARDPERRVLRMLSAGHRRDVYR